MAKPKSRQAPRVGRPSLGSSAHTRVVPIKVSADEYATVVKAVAAKNAELASGEKPTTVSGWFRQHGLAAATGTRKR
jgi:hypothetical protein